MTSAETSPGPVLVTGAAGFVGSYLVELLVAEGADVVGWQRPGTTPLTAAAVRWMPMELLDAEAVSSALAELRPSAIYHLAGSAHVADSWSHTRETFEGNVLATHHLLQGLHRHGLRPRVLVSGSATIYAPSAQPITENSLRRQPMPPASWRRRCWRRRPGTSRAPRWRSPDRSTTWARGRHRRRGAQHRQAVAHRARRTAPVRRWET
jgi:nucleoside-diphosphate-sugar epimerase